MPRIAFLLALVLLIPVASLAAVTGSSAISSWKARQAAVQVRADVDAPSALMDARALVVNEGVPSTALANAAEAGVSAAKLAELSGDDFAGSLRRARPPVDADQTLRQYPTLADDLVQLHQLRTKIDLGHASYRNVLAFFTGFTADVDAVWQRQLDRLRGDVTATSRATGVLADRIVVLPRAYAVLTTLVQRAADTNDLLRPRPSAGSLQALIEADGAFAADTAALAGHLGPQASAAWNALQRDPAVNRFSEAVDQTVAYALSGRRPPLANEPAARARVFANGGSWLNHLQAVVQGASADVRDIARHSELAATRSFQLAVANFLLSVLFAVGAAIMLTRSVVRPLRRLSGAARKVAEGDFALTAIAPSGPREVAETISAVDDMTAVLAAVESFTVTLAQDPTAPSLDVPLPGRTGLALQTTLDRLRESVRDAQRRRAALHEVATRDGLTGLLNRAAALEAVELALGRAREDGSTVMALFVDLDGLKAINDTHGHKVGDEAIRLAAQALQAAVRASDVVARLGGDEFLIAGSCARSQDDARALARRLHHAVADSALEADRLPIPLRCSVGIAISVPSDDVESLIHKADQALYAAKRQGRNQISWYQVQDRPHDTGASFDEPAERDRRPIPTG